MTRPSTTFTGPDLCALSAREAVELLRRGDVSPTEMLDASEARRASVEPVINAMPTACYDRARADMANLPARAEANSGHPAWLAGLPLAIKDLTPVKGVRTTMGNPYYADWVPEASDLMVERLEDRGGLVVGKTNTPEFGAGGNSTNRVLGATRNPWDTRMNAGGSSGGAAASLAAGEVWLAHGSDLMGSLRTPAAHCSVLGLRAAPGRCSGGSKNALHQAEGMQGPMARDVRDMALFLDAMTGWDPRAPISLDAPAVPFQTAVAQAPERAPRIAFSEDQNGFAAVEGNIRTTLRAAMTATEKAGATVEDYCPDLPGLNDSYLALRAVHYGTTLGLEPDAIRETFGDRVRDNVAYAMEIDATRIYAGIRGRSEIYRIMLAFFDTYDVLAIPVVGIAPRAVEEEYPQIVDGEPIGTYETWLRFSFLATTALLPALSMPAGFTEDGLPVGLQLIGPPRGEAQLLQTALFIEEALALPVGPIDPITR
ncbi:amidase [Chachezhania antarctica]|uniref:amidase n=1 Tax=Chachezhania antarctica TaxID=2340860 RepID=UPI000EAD4BFB|nr:amidase family protein [Chachezhania antarctica]|tara:strand:- start:279 stop:1730 length:1452 start_codon:yes stop_codon:yes gene_type:complete